MLTACKTPYELWKFDRCPSPKLWEYWSFFVTINLYDPSKKFEQVFVRVTSWKGETVQGILASELALIHNHSKGEKPICNESEILDWTISKPNGTEEGNFVGKFLDTYQP